MDPLLAQLLKTFAEELEERGLDFERDLLDLEKETDPAVRDRLLESLLRTAHSLKGAAGSVNIEVIGSLCHGIEDILGPARHLGAAIEPAGWKLCFAAGDALRSAARQLRDDAPLDKAHLTSVVTQIGELIFARGAPPVRESVPDPPVLPKIVMPSRPVETPPPLPAVVPAPVPQVLGAVRIAAEKLDSLLAQSGELLLARRRAQNRRGSVAELQTFVKQWRDARWNAIMDGNTVEDVDRLDWVMNELIRLDQALAGDQHLLEASAAPLHAEVTRLRMLPFSVACDGLARAARDVAFASGKEAELVVEGGAVEIDRSVIDGLRAPLLHLVRNAVDHGVGTPERRRARGKPLAGRVSVSAALRGDKLEVMVADDGSGLKLEEIGEEIRRKGLVLRPGETVADAIFLPGFSTSREITSISGRGIGLDAVKASVEAMRGTVEVASIEGEGTRFILSLPLTLTTIRALLVESAGQIFAIDGASVRRVAIVAAKDLHWSKGVPLFIEGDEAVPVVGLSEVLGLSQDRERAKTEKLNLVIVGLGGQRRAFVVDALNAEREILVRNLGPRLAGLHHIVGATVLLTGRIALILNTAELMRTTLGRSRILEEQAGQAAGPAVKRRILVVDDSLTSRAMERNILEVAGYEVDAAADGAEAWDLLQNAGADIVVSDIEMPRMDGFALVEAIRASSRFRDLPVILVTSRARPEDKARGLEVGANAYIVKSAFEQDVLLEAVARFL